MSRLRSNNWRCAQQLNPEGEICGEVATYRCNACRETYCDDCWLDHLEMTVVIKEDAGKASPNGEPLSSPQQAEGYPAEGK